MPPVIGAVSFTVMVIEFVSFNAVSNDTGAGGALMVISAAVAPTPLAAITGVVNATLIGILPVLTIL